MTQFAFLAADFAELHDLARRAETAALSDPRGACFYARLTLETALRWLYRVEPALKTPYDDSLSALIHEPSFERLAGAAIVTKAKFVKDQGNRAVHDARAPTTGAATGAVRELFHVTYWLARTYAKTARPPDGIAFDPGRLEKTLTITATTVAQIQKLRAQANEDAKARAEAERARMASEEGRTALEAELAALRAEVAALRKANEAVPDRHDYDEATTRDAFIDLLLAEAGWPLDQPRDREFRVEGMPNAAGEGFVDYVLWGADGLPLALVEAKRTRKDPREGQQQAKLYADCLERAFGRRPLIFYTNGYEHWFWDDHRYPPRRVSGFLKRDELELALKRRERLRPLNSVEVDVKIVGRPYQTRAIRRVGESFEKDARRKALLVMATGSGKTRTVVALIDQLMRANWVRRVLFLADRVALVRQAHGVFKKHLSDTASANLIDRHDARTNDQTGARVLLSTYPTMMNLIEEMQDGRRRFGPGHFDLIVIDEAHRSVYRKYRAIFEHFDALLVGLTATPRDEIDRDTYSLFDLERGVPTDAFDLEDAVKGGYLVPPEPISVPLRFVRQGMRYADLPDDEKEEWDAIEWDEDGGRREEVGAAEINQWLFNANTVDKVLQHLMTHGLRVAGGDRLGKTIIFAKNSRHAEFIVERFDLSFPHLKGAFARRIDYSVPYAQSLIDAFSEAEKPPHIAVSVDMLDTGIDVPEVVNLVFFKAVRSKTKFWQMLGRGTRLCPDLFGPGRHKENFRVFDFCQNFEFFDQNPELREGSVAPSLSERLFTSRVDLVGLLDCGGEQASDHNAALRGRIIERLRDEVAGMSLDNVIVRQKRRAVEKFKEPGPWDALDQASREELKAEVAGLPTALVDDDLPAKQFDLLVLRAQAALLQGSASFAEHKAKIIAIAAELAQLENIPQVRHRIALIHEVQSETFWEGANALVLDDMRRALRDLVKLIEPQERKIIYTDFEDELGEAAAAPLALDPVGTDKGRFKMKVRQFLEAHKDHIAFQKIRRAERVTPMDIAELERMFLSEGLADEERLGAIRAEGGLALFLRSILGLDREAAKAAFAASLDLGSLTAAQIEFIDLIIDYLTAEGVIDPALLYESPFTDHHEMGVSGIFTQDEARSIIETLRRINEVAAQMLVDDVTAKSSRCEPGSFGLSSTNLSPIDALDQRLELRAAERYEPVPNRRPYKVPFLKTLCHQDEACSVPHQELQAVPFLGSEDKDRAGKWTQFEFRLDQGRKRVHSLSEIDGLGRDVDANRCARVNHRWPRITPRIVEMRSGFAVSGSRTQTPPHSISICSSCLPATLSCSSTFVTASANSKGSGRALVRLRGGFGAFARRLRRAAGLLRHAPFGQGRWIHVPFGRELLYWQVRA